MELKLKMINITVTTIDFLLTGGDSYDFSNAIDVVDTCEVMEKVSKLIGKKMVLKHMTIIY